MAEWSIVAVSKTVEPQGSGGSNPSLSAGQSAWNCVKHRKNAVLFCKYGDVYGMYAEGD